MSRKTFNVADLKNTVNEFLAESAPELNGERVGATMMLTSVLHATGNYAGFRYLDANEITDPESLPGIRHDQPRHEWFTNTDPTRVHYF